MGRKKSVFFLIGVILLFVSYQSLFQKDSRVYPIIQNHHVGLIDETGEVVIEPKYLELGKPSEGWVAVRESSQWKYLSLDGKKEIAEKYDQAGPFVKGIAPASKNDQNGFIDETGNWVKTGYDFVEAFSGGFAVVGDQSGMYFIDESFENKFQMLFEDAGPFLWNLAPVKQNGQWGIINHLGELVVSYQFEEMPLFGEEGIVGIQNGQYGMIDSTGVEIIPFQYDRLIPMSEDRIGYFDGQAWGFLNPRNEVVIPNRYSSVTAFKDDRAYVIDDGQGRIINRMGNPVGNEVFSAFDLEALFYASEFSYQFYSEMKAPFQDHTKLILEYRKWKVITDQGETIIELIEEGLYE